MLLNELSETAWAGLAGFAAAIYAVIRGSKRHPADVGSEPPPPDRTEYVLIEVRAIAKKLDGIERALLTHSADTAASIEELGDKASAIHTDTQVLRDRRDR